MEREFADGAGVLPFAELNGEKYLLLHTKTKGKKVGFWIDFGGGINENEEILDCACREFNEETFGFFFNPLKKDEQFNLDLHKVENSDRVTNATKKMLENWKKETKKYKFCYYHFFLIEIPYQDLTLINEITKKYDKHLEWIKIEDVLNNFDKLFIRIRIKELENDLKNLVKIKV